MNDFKVLFRWFALLIVVCYIAIAALIIVHHWLSVHDAPRQPVNDHKERYYAQTSWLSS